MILHFNKTPELDATIWMNLRRKAIRPRIQHYLFKAMHSVFMLGKFWENIPNHSHCIWCASCNKVESMDHILTGCPAKSVQLIWNLAQQTWPHSPSYWPQIDFGMILGCRSLVMIPWCTVWYLFLFLHDSYYDSLWPYLSDDSPSLYSDSWLLTSADSIWLIPSISITSCGCTLFLYKLP